jgi:acetyltransferase-like isoleucine patch superfamily enzyme
MAGLSLPANDADFRLIAGCDFGPGVIVHAFANLYGCRIGAGTRVGPFVENVHGELPTDEDWTLLRTVVETGARLGSGAVVLGGVRIGAGATVGAGAVVCADVAPHAAVTGVPARAAALRAAAGTSLVRPGRAAV